MSLVLVGNEFIIVVFVLMVFNFILCIKKIPLIAVPLSFFTWIIFFISTIDLSMGNFILIFICLLLATSSFILNIQDVRGK
jgi:hypothetical protein